MRFNLLLSIVLLVARSSSLAGTLFDRTPPLTETGDLSEKMLGGIHRFIERKIDLSIEGREHFWQRDLTSPANYEKSIAPNRDHFKKIIGIVEDRVSPALEKFSSQSDNFSIVDTAQFRLFDVRWAVLEGVSGEGLLFEPKGNVLGFVIVIPDADQTPELASGLIEGNAPNLSWARQLADRGFMVLVPALIDRGCDFSGNPKIAMTNQTHREWLHRQAYHMGRHIIGYEIQKILGAVDWFKQTHRADRKIGIAGYGEGGLLGFYASAIDSRIDACLVSGYFDSRQKLWTEPLYRNVWGLLREFGDAEIATLIAPRPLIVESSPGPEVKGPPPAESTVRRCAAPGVLQGPALETARAEFDRIEKLIGNKLQERHFANGADALGKFATLLSGSEFNEAIPGRLSARRGIVQDRERQKRAVHEIQNHIQGFVNPAEERRDQEFLKAILPEFKAVKWTKALRFDTIPWQRFADALPKYRKAFAEEILGTIEDPPLPPNPKARQIYHTAKYDGFEVMLDVFPDVFAWGILLVPNDIKAGEKRPVVVCQHGRNSLPKDVIEGDDAYYHNFGAKLAEQGFITFAPHNLYRIEERYRGVARKGNTIKLSMFSFILAQHAQILRWLDSLPIVDATCIGFYGLSYGGETAVRIPPLLDGYCLSICSGDFNDWVKKVTSVDYRYSFMFTDEFEMPYFNMGSTFNYAELGYMMVPRPFMVERGHHDGVAPDQWVASEYAKVRWLYDQLGLGDKTAIEFFNGGHTINGEGTFEFLHKHLQR